MHKMDLVAEFLLDFRIKIIFPHLKGRLLDVGCGTNKLVRKYGNGIGVDVFQFGGADLILEDTSEMPFANESFDTITVISALNHINNRIEVLREIRRLLKADGRLMVTMIPPMISRIWHILRSPWDRDQKERKMKSGEIYGMTKQQVRSLLRSCEFAVEKEISFMFKINTLYIAKKI